MVDEDEVIMTTKEDIESNNGCFICGVVEGKYLRRNTIF